MAVNKLISRSVWAWIASLFDPPVFKLMMVSFNQADMQRMDIGEVFPMIWSTVKS